MVEVVDVVDVLVASAIAARPCAPHEVTAPALSDVGVVEIVVAVGTPDRGEATPGGPLDDGETGVADAIVADGSCVVVVVSPNGFVNNERKIA